MIRLEHITKTYVNAGKKFNAADDVSLEIKKGEIFGRPVIGFSGAGNPRWCAVSTCLSARTAEGSL